MQPFHDMPEYCLASQCLIILLGVKYGFVVAGPGGPAGGQRNPVLQHFSGFQVFDINGILPSAHGIDPQGHIAVIGTHTQTSNLVIRVAFGHLIYIGQDLFTGFQAFFLPAINWILFALFITGIIEIAILLIGHTLIVLFDPANDLIEELLLELFGSFHHRLSVGIFSFQVGDYFWILSLPKPIIIIDAGVTMHGQLFGYFCSNWCFH